jgi:hypothetical protein
MPDPVIIDDGGSTRLKRLTDSGSATMNGLLNVDPHSRPPQSSDSLPGPFNHIRVVTIDRGGTPTRKDYDLVAADKFTILSCNGQSAVGTIDVAGQLTITLEGETNNAPLVEAILSQNQLRYEVTNAGRIHQISVTLNGNNNTIDDLEQNLYTTVVVSG